jgi:branched-chain amino acid transport system ATP-binding protein
MSLVMRVARRWLAMAKGSVIAEGQVHEAGIDELHQHVMV